MDCAHWSLQLFDFFLLHYAFMNICEAYWRQSTADWTIVCAISRVHRNVHGFPVCDSYGIHDSALKSNPAWIVFGLAILPHASRMSCFMFHVRCSTCTTGSWCIVNGVRGHHLVWASHDVDSDYGIMHYIMYIRIFMIMLYVYKCIAIQASRHCS